MFCNMFAGKRTTNFSYLTIATLEESSRIFTYGKSYTLIRVLSGMKQAQVSDVKCLHFYCDSAGIDGHTGIHTCSKILKLTE